ncbi:hypothetical protein MML48_2g00000411 [Holotrichia oblita]|uniref:Uncharacterized protein n=1 Tax=Holotrichia oblita TaxID=644536 RepID=A0ACB9TPK9_HOLOL|nr:hypothetical protein MML48_2g00000411 [Holotrichia oblita]
MPLIWRFFLASYSLFLYTLAAEVFSNSFLVKFRRGVELEEADDVARRNGFVNVGPVNTLRVWIKVFSTLLKKLMKTLDLTNRTTIADVFHGTEIILFKPLEVMNKLSSTRVKEYISETILGSSKEYHFINHDVPTARTKRSIPHVRKLKVEPLVNFAANVITGIVF